MIAQLKERLVPQLRRLEAQWKAPVAAAAVLALLLVLVIGLLQVLQPRWPPRAVCYEENCKEARLWISWSVTVVVLLVGIYRYWRAQVWKRAEFVSGEMELFFSRAPVQRAMTMIDWARRNVNLHGSEEKDPKGWPLVTREQQTVALLAHSLVQDFRTEPLDENTRAEASDSEWAGFTRDEAAIRDSYDGFLDGLERFGGFLSSRLVTTDDLQPYLAYWIEDIARVTRDPAESAWTCMLLLYIHCYGYRGVQRLFSAFGWDIEPGKGVYRESLAFVTDEKMRTILGRYS